VAEEGDMQIIIRIQRVCVGKIFAAIGHAISVGIAGRAEYRERIGVGEFPGVSDAIPIRIGAWRGTVSLEQGKTV
jgi:hypothetical protein